jgi:hypothetical protein
MAGGFDKQASSRPLKYQVLQFNSATVFSTNFGPSVQQIRVMAQIGGWGTINQTTSDSVIASSAGGAGMIITGLTTGYPAAVTTVAGSPYPEYFTVTPGQFFTFSSTSTSTGAVTITEMA